MSDRESDPVVYLILEVLPRVAKSGKAVVAITKIVAFRVDEAEAKRAVDALKKRLPDNSPLMYVFAPVTEDIDRPCSIPIVPTFTDVAIGTWALRIAEVSPADSLWVVGHWICWSNGDRWRHTEHVNEASFFASQRDADNAMRDFNDSYRLNYMQVRVEVIRFEQINFRQAEEKTT